MSTRLIDLKSSVGTKPFWRRILYKQVQFLLDLMVLGGAFYFAYLLRFDFALPSHEHVAALTQLPMVVFVQSLVLMLNGVYQFIWRYIGLREIKRFIHAALWTVIPFMLLRLFLSENWQEARIPLSVTMIDTCLGFGGVLGLRVLRRELYERKRRKSPHKRGAEHKKPILLIGAGRAGVLTVAEIQNRGEIDIEVKGFLDDDSTKLGSVINGVKVLGRIDALPRFVRDLKIDHVVISIAQASRKEFRRILNICEGVPVKVKVIPGLQELLQGTLKVTRIRDVQIEDLLGREPIQLDNQIVESFLTGKTVMVTGAGGSIGSELARQVARFRPTRILLVERSEFALFNIERELRNTFPQLSLFPLVADVGDEMRMRSIFSSYAPQILLHAAAHKHVPMMELNTSEAVKNNILATYTLGKLAGEHGLETFVLISSDKAVHPTSVMGATKRVAELVVQDLDQRFDTRYVAVRFGNVIGSAGSVIPIFREQIYKGGPVTVTHPDMVRYFMTIPEASQLVLQAGAMGHGSEIFILDMGEPVRILDLAKETIRLSGLKPYDDIDIVFTGIRPGEKLFEELGGTDETLEKTRHPKIFIGKIARYSSEKIAKALERFELLASHGWDKELRQQLNEVLPEAQLKPEYLAPLPFGDELPRVTLVSGTLVN